MYKQGGGTTSHSYPVRESGNSFDSDDDEFGSIRTRNRFVRKVYNILSLQLTISFIIILIVALEQRTREFFHENAVVLLIVSTVVFLIFTFAIVCACCSNIRRIFPLNLICLGVITIAFSIIAALMSVRYDTRVLIYAMGSTALVCLVVSLFAIQTKWDLTQCGMCLCISTLSLVIFGVVIMILHLCGIHMKALDIVYSGLAVVLFSMFLMYDTQQIIGGRRFEISEEEYVYGALMLYIDIMYIFIHLLRLCGYLNE